METTAFYILFLQFNTIFQLRTKIPLRPRKTAKLSPPQWPLAILCDEGVNGRCPLANKGPVKIIKRVKIAHSF